MQRGAVGTFVIFFRGLMHVSLVKHFNISYIEPHKYIALTKRDIWGFHLPFCRCTSPPSLYLFFFFNSTVLIKPA